MSAERLREAAGVLRQRIGDEALTSQRVMPTAVHLNSAKYLVLAPPVALALAGWLDSMAQVTEARVSSAACQFAWDALEDLDASADYPPSIRDESVRYLPQAERLTARIYPMPLALAVADAILGVT